MRGQLDHVQPETFNPSARSLAFRKLTWQRAGGFPDWLYTSEDTLFDIKLRRMGVRWAFAGDAVVHWRPRTTLRSIARQFYLYGRGRGHTQIEAGCYFYHLRNAALMLMLGLAGFGFPPLWGLVGLLAAYFYIWTFHGKAIRVARRIGRRAAYGVALVVCWVVLSSSTAGYVVGSLQRLRRRAVYRDRMEEYLAIGEAHS
jgi:succinoglycan biosynthesis protein ExoA